MPDLLVFDFTTGTVSTRRADGFTEPLGDRPLVVVGDPAPPRRLDTGE